MEDVLAVRDAALVQIVQPLIGGRKGLFCTASSVEMLLNSIQ